MKEFDCRDDKPFWESASFKGVTIEVIPAEFRKDCNPVRQERVYYTWVCNGRDEGGLRD